MAGLLSLLWLACWVTAGFFIFKPRADCPPVANRVRAAITTVTVFVLGAVLIAFVSPTPAPTPTTATPSNKAPAPAKAAAEKPAPKAPAEPPSQWSYATDRDEMRGTVSVFANVYSENKLNLGFPYDAEEARLSLRKRPSDGTSVMLHAPGQFLCNTYNDETVSVKFDDGPIMQFTCSEPSDSSTGLLFINSEKRFIEKLKTSKRVIIEAPMFQAGRQQMTFNVEGLNWPPKTTDTK